MQNIFTIQNILIYIIFINLITFLAMYIDKQKAKQHKWRTKEGTLFMLVILGGGIGGIVGIYMFRHKTKKLTFTVGFPTILILEILFIIYWLVVNPLKTFGL
ncbi:MAG: DUF1294 domain-containing protein [Lachnospiraceae bacterium]|jgi:uncharacterized membrane protein YsdA (DUF1294 family)|nr:DUF1294 domain-containing protein [Lachnospiraceae bacterium]